MRSWFFKNYYRQINRVSKYTYLSWRSEKWNKRKLPAFAKIRTAAIECNRIFKKKRTAAIPNNNRLLIWKHYK
jgi:hypothetical protein